MVVFSYYTTRPSKSSTLIEFGDKTPENAQKVKFTGCLKLIFYHHLSCHKSIKILIKTALFYIRPAIIFKLSQVEVLLRQNEDLIFV